MKTSGLEHLTHRFLLYRGFRYNPFIFCIHSENTIQVLFRNMPFSLREKAPGMTSVINSSQFSTCKTTLEVLRHVFGLPSTRQTLTYWSKPSRGASRQSEGWSIRWTAERWVCLAWQREECVWKIYCCFQLCNGKISRWWKEAFSSKANSERIWGNGYKQQPLQMPGRYQEKVLHNGDRPVIGIGPREKWISISRHVGISTKQGLEQSDLIWHWICYRGWTESTNRDVQRFPSALNIPSFSITEEKLKKF